MTSRVPIVTLVCVIFALAGCSTAIPSDDSSMPNIQPVGLMQMPEELDGGWVLGEDDSDDKDARNISRAYDLVPAASALYSRGNTELRVRAVAAQSPRFFALAADPTREAKLFGDVSCLLDGDAATCMRTSADLTLWIGPLEAPADATAALVESTWAVIGGGASVEWPVGTRNPVILPETLGELTAVAGDSPEQIAMDVAALSDAFGGAPAAEKIYSDDTGSSTIVATAVSSTAPATYVPYVDPEELGLLAAPYERVSGISTDPGTGDAATCLVHNAKVATNGDPADLDPTVVWCERIGDGVTVRIDRVGGDIGSDIQAIETMTDELYDAVAD